MSDDIESIKAQLAAMTRERDEARRALAYAQDPEPLMEAELDLAMEEIAALRKQIADMTSKRDTLYSMTGELEAELVRAKDERDTMRRQLADITGDRDETRRRLVAMTRYRDRFVKELADMTRERDAAMMDLAEARATLAFARSLVDHHQTGAAPVPVTIIEEEKTT